MSQKDQKGPTKCSQKGKISIRNNDLKWKKDKWKISKSKNSEI